jgi:hypothetical protein
MKKVIFLFFIFLSALCFSQNEITILLKDEDTRLPIEDALVTILRTNQAIISNADGELKLKLTRPSLIEISHTSYEKVQIKSITLKTSVNEFFLKKNTLDLQEVILTNKNPQDILKELVKNSQKKLTIPANLRVFTREFFKKDGNYSFYNDGLLNFQIIENKNTISTDILVEQNRTLGLIDDFDKDLLGYNLNNLMENYYKFDYLKEVLDFKSRKKYDFLLLTYPQNEDYLVIRVKPLITAEGFLSDYTIIFDDNKKVIIEVSSFLPPERAKTNSTFLDFKNRKIYKTEYKTTYRLETRDYYLANSKETIGFSTQKNKVETNFEVSNYIITTEFRANIFKYKEMEIFKEKTLLNKKDSILTEYWDIDTGVLLTETEKDIINKLTK